MAGQFAAAAVPDLRQPPQRVVFPRFRQFQRTIHRLPPGALTPRIVTAPRDDAIFVFLHKPPEVVIAVARFPPVPARRDHLPPGVIAESLHIPAVVGHLDQPVQRVILTGNLPVYLLLSTVFRQYFTQQPGLVVHIIGQLIRRGKTVPEREVPASAGRGRERGRQAGCRGKTEDMGAGGPGALQTSRPARRQKSVDTNPHAALAGLTCRASPGNSSIAGAAPLDSVRLRRNRSLLLCGTQSSPLTCARGAHRACARENAKSLRKFRSRR